MPLAAAKLSGTRPLHEPADPAEGLLQSLVRGRVAHADVPGPGRPEGAPGHDRHPFLGQQPFGEGLVAEPGRLDAREDVERPERLERGEVDLFLTISTHMLEGHPRRPMYKDEHAVIRWSGADYDRELTAEAFLAAHHAVAYFGADRHPAFTETYFSQQGIARKIDVRVPIFSALPHAVINTQRLATMYRRHAEYFARFLPLTVHEPPVFLPTVTEEAQWHTLRHADEGLKWLLELFTTHARRLSPDLTAEPSTETADSTH